MTVLFRWVFVSSFMRIVTIALGVILLFMVAESFSKAALIGKSMSVGQLFEYLMLKAPFMVVDFLPVIVLLGASVYMTEISHHHELVALRAAGVSLRFILTPLLALACCVALFTFALGEWVEPVSNVRLDTMEKTLVQGKKPVSADSEQWFRDEGRFFRIQPLQGKYFKLMMLEIDKNGQWQGRTDASKAYYEQGVWFLEKVYVSKPDDKQRIRTQTLPRLTLQTHIGPTTVAAPKARDMKWLALYQFSQSLADAGLDAKAYEYQLHKRIAGPLACLIMVILAYSLCGNMGSRISANSKGLMAALTLGLLYYIFNTSMSVMTNGGYLPVVYAVWWPDVMFLGIAGYLLLAREGY